MWQQNWSTREKDTPPLPASAFDEYLVNLDKFSSPERKQDLPAFVARSPDTNIRTRRKITYLQDFPGDNLASSAPSHMTTLPYFVHLEDATDTPLDSTFH